MGRVLIWQCIRFIPACPVSIPTLFIAAQSGGVKKPPQDEGAVLACSRPRVTHTHSPRSNPQFSCCAQQLLGKAHLQHLPISRCLCLCLCSILCLQRILPRIVRVVEPSVEVFVVITLQGMASDGNAPPCPPQLSTSHQPPHLTTLVFLFLSEFFGHGWFFSGH